MRSTKRDEDRAEREGRPAVRLPLLAFCATGTGLDPYRAVEVGTPFGLARWGVAQHAAAFVGHGSSSAHAPGAAKAGSLVAARQAAAAAAAEAAEEDAWAEEGWEEEEWVDPDASPSGDTDQGPSPVLDPLSPAGIERGLLADCVIVDIVADTHLAQIERYTTARHIELFVHGVGLASLRQQMACRLFRSRDPYLTTPTMRVPFH